MRASFVLLLSLALLRPATGMVFKAAGTGMALAGNEAGEASDASRSRPIGFAALNGGTTGGAGGPVVTVSTAAAFVAAVQGDAPRVVQLTAFLNEVSTVYVGSNKTILGIGGTSGPAGFAKTSLVLRNVRNVIIRNLAMSVCRGADNNCVKIMQGSQNVWVDHNDFTYTHRTFEEKDQFNDLLAVTRGSSYVTISNNNFHDHQKCLLLGHCDQNTEDAVMLVTVHHNYFSNVGSRLPSVRFGKAHIFNNLYDNVMASGISARMGAQLLVEGNVFINAKSPVVSHQSPEPGFCVLRDNLLQGPWTPDCALGNFTTAPYSVKVSPASTVQATVQANAGVGVIQT